MHHVYLIIKPRRSRRTAGDVYLQLTRTPTAEYPAKDNQRRGDRRCVKLNNLCVCLHTANIERGFCLFKRIFQSRRCFPFRAKLAFIAPSWNYPISSASHTSPYYAGKVCLFRQWQEKASKISNQIYRRGRKVLRGARKKGGVFVSDSARNFHN